MRQAPLPPFPAGATHLNEHPAFACRAGQVTALNGQVPRSHGLWSPCAVGHAQALYKLCACYALAIPPHVVPIHMGGASFFL